jgi:hypothetical protein
VIHLPNGLQEGRQWLLLTTHCGRVIRVVSRGRQARGEQQKDAKGHASKGTREQDEERSRGIEEEREKG